MALTALKKRKTKSAWAVYILRCADGSLYTGITRDVARRVEEHNSNGLLAARYTRARRPVALVYQEPAATRSAAGKREYRIKRLTRRDKQRLVADKDERGMWKDDGRAMRDKNRSRPLVTFGRNTSTGRTRVRGRDS